jgi:hypothetical protein
MALNIEAARKEGYSDAEIVDYLGTQRKLDIRAARKEGYKDSEILQHLASSNSSPTAPQGASGQAPGMASDGLKRATGDLATGRPELDIQVDDPIAPVVTPEPSFLDQAKQAWNIAMNQLGGQTLEQVQMSHQPKPTSVLDTTSAEAPAFENPASVRIPINKKYRQQFEEHWDSLSEGERALMSRQPGVAGMLAKERLELFANQDQTAPDAADDLDTRAEKRASRLVEQGIAPDVAALAARMGAKYGALPGTEMGLLGVTGEASESDFDFETAEAFNRDVGSQNVLKRGAAKGALGLGKAVTGMGEFIADVIGTERVGEAIGRGSKAIRRQEEAIGASRGDLMARAVEGAVASIGQQLPFMMAGAATGGAGIPLAAIAVTSFGNEYSDGRSQGQSMEQALARASMYSAFEVIGERFGLGEQMEMVRRAMRVKGKIPDQRTAAGLLWDMLVKQVPGEVLTTTGQFSTDKFTGGGVGLSPDATFDDYFDQVVETIATTMVQSVMMGGGTMILSGNKPPADSQPPSTPGIPESQAFATEPEIQPGVSTNAQPTPPPAPAAPQEAAPALAGEAAGPSASPDTASTPVTIDRRALADAFTIDDEGTIDAAQATTAVRAQVESALAAGTTVTQGRGKNRVAVSSADEVDVPAILAGKSRLQIGGQPLPATQQTKGGEINVSNQQTTSQDDVGLGSEASGQEQETPPAGQAEQADAVLAPEPTLAEKAKAPVVIAPSEEGLTVSVDGKPQATYPTNELPEPLVAAETPPDAAPKKRSIIKAENEAPKPGKVGAMLGAGETVLTTTGRETSPFPKIDITTNGKAGNTVKRVEKWLMENALAEAESRGDEFNARQFRANLSKPSQADKDSAEYYLFDQGFVQPARKSALKPLVETQPETPPKKSIVKAENEKPTLRRGDSVSFPIDADGNRNIGEITSIFGNKLTVTTDDGARVTISARGAEYVSKDAPATPQPTRNISGPESRLTKSAVDVDPFAPPSLEQRLQSDAELRGHLERMASEAGWEEEGGKLIRATEDETSPDYGKVVGRTKWLPKALWWAARPTGFNEKRTKETIRKALAGEPLSKPERRMVEFLRDVADGKVEDFLPTREEAQSSKPEDVLDVALVARMIERANEIDEAAVERLAIQHGDDDDGFMTAIKELVHDTDTQTTAGSGAQSGPAPSESQAGKTEAKKPVGDLFGDDVAAKQAVADEARKRDAKRNSGQDSLETGDPSDMFSQAKNQTDLMDTPAPKKAQEVSKNKLVSDDAAAVARAKDKTPEQFANWVRGRYGKPKAKELTESGQVDRWYAEANPAKAEPVVEPEAPKPVEQKPATPAPAKPTANIQDFGQRIEGARKDYAAKLRDAQTADIAKVPLSESWPEPDYAKLLEGGADSWAVGFMHAARDDIPTKPQKSWKLGRWVSQVTGLRDMVQKVMDGAYDRDMIEGRESLKSVYDRIELYQTVGHDKSLKGVRVVSGHYSVFKGIEYKPSKTIWSVESNGKQSALSNWPNMLGHGDTRAEAIAAFKKTWDATTPEQDAKKAIKFELYGRRADKTYFIGKKVGRNVVELKDGFTDVKTARAYLLEHHDELVTLLAKKKELPSERREENAPRIGIDHRNGADVTPEQFQEAFGFRGVQFGTQMEGARRQADLNDSYDALMDLAGVLGVPPKALSLNGELGLAFGARGHGGKLAPKAHYERGEVVINLTKRTGAGSLAHEWLHGLDNYFSRRGGNKAGFISLIQKAPEGVRPELFEAFKNVIRAINSTELPKRSGKLDQTRSKPYWVTTEEMVARSFESYIIAKLQDQGASNDYLANIVSPAYWDAATGLGMQKDGTYPYPLESEMPIVRAAFDHFFDVIESKPTDAGVALYQRGDATPGKLPERQVTAAINEVLRPFHRRPVLIVRQTYAQLPSDVRAAIERRGDKPGDMRAIYWNGKFYAVADDIPSMEAIPELVLHEVVGHFGLDAMLTEADKQAILDGFYDSMTDAVNERGVQEFGAKWDVGNIKTRRLATEEVLAYHFQDYLKDRQSVPEPAKTWMERLKAKISAFIKKMLRLAPVYKLPKQYDQTFMNRLADDLLRSLKSNKPLSGDGKTKAEAARDARYTEKAGIFYSHLTRSAQLAKISVGRGEQWLNTLRNMPGVKAEEIEAVDLEQFLGDRIKISKQEVVDYLGSNGVQVTETVLGGDGKVKFMDSLSAAESQRFNELLNIPGGEWNGNGYSGGRPLTAEEQSELSDLQETHLHDRVTTDAARRDAEKSATKFSKYALPGGSNYRELLLTLPSDTKAEDSGGAYYRETTGDFRSSHWDQPNVIAHIRFDERADADGKRVMHIAEVQSDWHQAGRKKGYRSPKKETSVADVKLVKEDQWNWWLADANGDEHKVSKADYERTGIDKAKQDIAFWETRKLADQNLLAVPNAPFKTTWPELAMKRAIRYAAENGFDRITWDTGATNAERYDLSKTLSSVALSGSNFKAFDLDGEEVMSRTGVRPEDLPDLIGKDAAEKLMAKKPNGTLRVLEGLDLKVGGEGMIGFYDRILPATVGKLIKKWGGKILSVRLPGSATYEQLKAAGTSTGLTQAQLDQMPVAERKALVDSKLPLSHGFNITDAMRQSAMQGLPLFQRNLPTANKSTPTAGKSADPADAQWQYPQVTKLGDGRLIRVINGIHSRVDQFLYDRVDYYLDTRRVVKAIAQKQGVETLPDNVDPMLGLELMPRRISDRVDTMMKDEFLPILEKMHALGLDIKRVEDHLQFRHARERNETIAQRNLNNPAMQDGGSGKFEREIADYFAALDPKDKAKLDEVAAMVKEYIKGTRQTLVGYGLESQVTMDLRAAAWPDYVPLQRADYENDAVYGIGQGISVKGSDSKAALGSHKEVVNILSNITKQREQAIIRGEKERVAVALYGLAEMNPNPDFWSTTNLPKIRHLDKQTGQVVSQTDPKWKSRDNVIVVKRPNRAGRIVERAIVFSERNPMAKRMVTALKGLDLPEMDKKTRLFGAYSRFISAINTQWSPSFGMVNFHRDWQEAMANLSTTPLKGKQVKVANYSRKALGGIFADARARRKGKHPTSEWAKWYERTSAAGGLTGFRDMFETDAKRADKVEQLFKQLDQGIIAKAPREIAGLIEDMNTMFESAVRVAAFRAYVEMKAAENGNTDATKTTDYDTSFDARAAQISKSITVNFNKRGRLGYSMNAWYAFSNAIIQGVGRNYETLTGPRGRAIIGGALLVGALQAFWLAAAGFDDDDDESTHIDSFVKNRSFLIPTGDGTYKQWPIPHGLRWIVALGRIVTEQAIHKGKTAGDAASESFGVLMDAFNPLGTSGSLLQMAAPTIADIPAGLAENKNYLGRSIYLEGYGDSDPTPGFARQKDTATPVGKVVARVMNTLSGGSDFTRGMGSDGRFVGDLFSPTPDHVDYLIQQLTGGPGREISKIWQTGESMLTGEDLPTYKVPLWGMISGSVNERAAERNAFYKLATEGAKHKAELEGRQADPFGSQQTLDDYLKEHPGYRGPMIAATNAQKLSTIRSEKRKAAANGATQEQLNAYDDRAAALITKTLQRNKELRQEAR